jgi:RimJ/RimL family protein N-acetyltransferase
MREGIKYGFSKAGLQEVFAITEVANIASQKGLLRGGFTLHKTYKEGEKDICCFRLERAD